MDAGRIESRVAQVLLRHITAGQRLTVALSGGLDSVVLLHVLKQLASPLDFRLTAHHVNHGISPRADEWADYCFRLCEAWGVQLTIAVVDVSCSSGAGLEGAARAARYGVLGEVDTDFVVLAQHQDDQAETLLLQLFRGAGVLGLGGMPEARVQQSAGGGTSSSPIYLRPLLDVPRQAIRDYATSHGLQWMDDDSNADRRFARNFLRHEILPVIDQRFPGAVANVAHAAAHCAEASELLNDLAVLDAGAIVEGSGIDIERLAELAPARAKNLLRFFLRRHGLRPPDQRRLTEMLRQLLTARRDRQLCLAHEGTELRRFRNRVCLVKPRSRRIGAVRFRWQGEPVLVFPESGGSLRFEMTRGDGVDVGCLRDSLLTLRERRGGERMKLFSDGPSRTLKNLLQESSMPPWERQRLPLLYVSERLAWAASVGVHADFRAAPDAAGVILLWEPTA